MALGRWIDDAYSGGEQPELTHPTPRWNKYLKWTWPLALLTAGALTMWTPAGWAIAVFVWLAISYPIRQSDFRNDKKPGTP